MPELPEVEFCRRALLRWTSGRHVVAVTVDDPRSVRRSRTDAPTAADPQGGERLREVVLGTPPGEIRRHGKRLLWSFADRALLLHLGMTGRWTRRGGRDQGPAEDDASRRAPGVEAAPGGGGPGPSPNPAPAGTGGRHTRVRLHLDDETTLHFTDPRLLGGIVPTDGRDGPRLLSEGLGPDALDHGLPPLPGRRPVKVALMDQAVVAGLGNLHAAEALWRARLHPATPCDRVTGELHVRLAGAVQEQLRFTLDLLSADDEIVYVEDAGAPNPFPLYARAGEPCPRCGAPIARMVQAARSTWWCPGCQPG